jgi:hypothetical protein
MLTLSMLPLLQKTELKCYGVESQPPTPCPPTSPTIIALAPGPTPI